MKTIDSIRATLGRHPTEYARGRAEHGALADYASPAHVLAALDLGSPCSHAERDAITLALIAAHQRAAHPLWQSILLAAYEPMLAGVWKRLFDKRDAESRVVVAFLEAIANVSLAHPPSQLALHLRHAVERTAFGSTAAGRLEPELLPLKDARKERCHESPEAVVLRADEERRLARELGALFGDDAETVLEVLVRARTGRESLVALIAEKNPALTPKQRARLYDELQRMRRRALTHLERRFACSA